jgi:hypothetical protein
MKLGFGSFLPRSFYSLPRLSTSWKKLWWIPFWITTSSAFSLPPAAKLKGYTYHLQRSHNQLSLPTVNSFFLRTVDYTMAPSPRATRTSTRSSSSSSTPLDDQEVTKEKAKKRKATSPKPASPKAVSPVKAKAASKVKGKAKQAPDNTETAVPESTAKKAKKTSAPKHQVLTERDDIPKLWDSDKAKQNGSYSKSCAMQFTRRHVTLS